MIAGRSFLITGGTGSIGNALLRQVLPHKPRRVIIFSRDEQKQQDMQRRYSDECLRFFIGDVRDLGRLELAMRGVDVVIHAAALKIITSCEYNPFEAVHTNIIGAENVIRAAIRSNCVERVVALSTDKCCAPVNLYGATKLAAEKMFQAAKSMAGNTPLFSVARYGNVVGSRGSVVPLYQSLAAAGKPLPVTDERMTRFWITPDQAATFILSILNEMQGGEVFIPKLPSMRIMDLAKAIAPDLPIEIIGIRPGEKLHETLLTKDEAKDGIETPGGYILNGYRGYLPDGFSYSSDRNECWLSRPQLRVLIEDSQHVFV